MGTTENSVHLLTLHANFPVSVEITAADQKDFHNLLCRICERYEASHPGRVMWVGGWGAMPGPYEDTRLTAMIMEREDYKRPAAGATDGGQAT